MTVGKIVAISMVKNESDVITHVVNHLLNEGVDEFFIADNLSTDSTLDQLYELADKHKNINILVDADPAYYQSKKMTAIMHYAASQTDAEWIIPFDADEIWYSKDGRTLAELFRATNYDIISAPVYDHIISDKDVETDNPFISINHREPNPERWPCVAFRYDPSAIIHMGNHGVTHPGIEGSDTLEIRHFQYRTMTQFANKVRNGKVAMDISTLDYGYCQHWREMGVMTDEELAQELDKLMRQTGLVYDPAPYRG